MVHLLALVSHGDREYNPLRIDVPRSADGVTIGRERSDVILSCPKDPNSLSRRHANLRMTADRARLVLTDESSNGTLVNGKRLKRGSGYELGVGDVVVFGIHPGELTYKVQEEKEYKISSDMLWVGKEGAEVVPLGATKLHERLTRVNGQAKTESERVVSESTEPKSNPAAVDRDAMWMLEYLDGAFHSRHRTFMHNPDEEALASDFVAFFEHFAEIMQQQQQSLFLELQSPLYVLGDLHGSFWDLKMLLEKLAPFGGDLRFAAAPICFLGDYVDRGGQGLEVVAYLFAMKLLAPDMVHLLRGNHEDCKVNGDVGTNGTGSFLYQCQERFGERGVDVWESANNAFAHLPICADVDRKVFLCHGGVPRGDLAPLRDPGFPRLGSVLDDDTPEALLARDLMWSDPCQNEGALAQAQPGGRSGVPDFPQSERASDNLVVAFSNGALTKFLDKERYDIMVRAHQFHAQGIRVAKKMQVITVFSCTSYCEGTNCAGVVMIRPNCVKLITYDPACEEKVRQTTGRNHKQQGGANDLTMARPAK